MGSWRDIPSNMDEKEAKSGAKWGVAWSVGWRAAIVLVVSGIGFSVLFSKLGIDNSDILAVATIATTIISAIVMVYLFGMGWYLKNLRENKEWATCPSCGKSYCIEYPREETISESVITKAEGSGKNRKYVNYRVGVKRIYWHCKECGKSGDGEVNYKDRV